MGKSIDDSLLNRFLEKETSNTENSKIFQWVFQSEENRKKFRQVHQVWHLSRLKQYQSEIDIDAAWLKLYRQLHGLTGKRVFFQRNFYWKVAASVAIILNVGFGSLWMNEHFQTPKSKVVSIESPSGEKSKVVLPDGTHVWLNSQTIVKYDASSPRKVKLQGEAYFEVVKDPDYPFEVSTNSGMKVTVLGTKFNLRSFEDEARFETTLEEGEVMISGADIKNPVLLTPGQQANYDIRNHKIRIQYVSTEIYTLWKNNELRFTDISFQELVLRIERWYGVKIKLDSKISLEDRFTMTIKTESLRELLSMMQLTSNFDYEINGEEVTIHAK